MALSDDFIRELKYANDIEAVLSSYLVTKRRGRNLVALCPFHSEKTPSFTIYPESQSYYCFGCGAGGDVITFIMAIENLTYIEAVRFLCQRAGIAMPEDTANNEFSQIKTRVLEMNRAAARFFHHCLVGKAGEEALQYLLNRGLSMQTIRHAGLGYAPNSWDTTSKYLKSQGFTQSDLIQGMLVAKSSRGTYYDQFRGRVMFPIIDLRGNVIAFGGRIMGDGVPKYINSSDTPVFKKSRNLYGLNLAKSTKEDYIILAEGYMDVIAIQQAGFENVVATLGTALTQEQARLLSTYTSNIVIAYDSDEAGQKATRRAIEIFEQVGLKVKVLSITGAKDPDEYIKKYGSARFKLLIEGSDDATVYTLQKIKQKCNVETPAGKVDYLRQAAKVLAELPGYVEREIYASRLASEMEVTKEAVLLEVKSVLQKKKREKDKKERKDLKIAGTVMGDRINPQRNQHYRAAVAEEHLIAILLKNPDYYPFIAEKITPGQFVTEFNSRVLERIYQCLEQNGNLDFNIFADSFSPPEIGRISGMAAACSEMNFSKQDALAYINTILQEKQKPDKKTVAALGDEDLKNFIANLANQKKKGSI